MKLPLDMRATTLVVSLDVIAAEIDRGGSASASEVLTGVLAAARASAMTLARELSPSYALAKGEKRSADEHARPVIVDNGGSNVIQFPHRRA